MEKNDKLLRNTIIYAIGNFGSKILNFIIVPLYTYYITTEEMGRYDLLVVIMTFLIPVVSLQLNDSVYRWLLDDNDKNEVIKTATTQVFLNVIICIILGSIGLYFYKVQYGFFILLMLATQIISDFLLQICRGLKHTGFYAIAGIIHTFCILLLNVIEVVWLKKGVEGLLTAQILSHAILMVLILCKESTIRFSLKDSRINRSLLKDMVKYSIPLIPNVICWSIVNMSDRFIIVAYLGTTANGVYSVAYKFPAIIQLFTNFFYLAWQETAIEEFGSVERDEYYSKIFDKYFRFLLPFVMILLPMTHIFSVISMSSEYKISWLYTGYLYLGTAFSALSGFLGTGYQSSKESKGAFYTTVIAALVNLGINLLLINKIGLQAAALSTFLAYLVLFIVRIIDTRKFFSLKIDWKELLGYIVGAVLFVIVYNRNVCFVIQIVLFFISVLIFAFSNYKLLFSILNSFNRRFRSRFKFKNK